MASTTPITWHAGHRAVHEQLGWVETNANTLRYVTPFLPSSHRLLYRHTVPFVPLVVLDEHERPWASIAVSPSGNPGFVTKSSDYELEVVLNVHPADPFHAALELASARGWQQPSRTGFFPQLQPESNQPVSSANSSSSSLQLIAAMAIDFVERTRTKLAGHILGAEKQMDGRWKVHLEVTQVLGNCPKYINTRLLSPKTGYNPTVTYSKFMMDHDDRLPGAVIDIIRGTDMIYFGTTFKPSPEEMHNQTAYLGMNNRGGVPGFLRVRNDGRTVVLPDYSGNRMLMSLGNIKSTPLATFAVADFDTGNVLYVTGEAKLLFGADARAIQPRSERIILINVTGYLAMSNALTFGQVGHITEESPYSPPIRYLAEEPGHEQVLLESTTLKLNKIDLLTSDLATFTFDVSQPISVRPGQHAVIDCSPFAGRAAYAHMPMPGLETSINDDSIRTWTISSSSDAPTSQIEITMREKKGGIVTGRFFQVARKLKQLRPDLLADSRELALEVNLIGIGGHFTHEESAEAIVMIAGGVGVTPFLSMLSSMSRQMDRKRGVTLIISTREPNVLAKLVEDSLGGSVPSHMTFQLIVFTRAAESGKHPLISSVVSGRLEKEYFKKLGDLSSSKVLICGPTVWEEIVLSGLAQVGVAAENVKRENFAY